MLGKFARLYADRSHNYSIASVASLKSNTFQVMPLERRGGLPVGRCQVEVFCGVFQLWFEAKLEEKKHPPTPSNRSKTPSSPS